MRRRTAALAAAALGLAVLALVALAGYRLAGRPGLAAGQRQPEGLDHLGEAPAFGLTDQLGRPVSSEQFRGRVVVANFIYTSCQDTCPLLSLRMQALQERLRREQLLGTQVQLLSFTIDPARDTPQVLRAYAERRQADPEAWRFLTGPERYVVSLVVQGFRLGVQPVAPGPGSDKGPREATDGGAAASSYDVMHSNRFVLIDRRGGIRAYYDGLELDLERVLRDVRHLLRRGRRALTKAQDRRRRRGGRVRSPPAGTGGRLFTRTRQRVSYPTYLLWRGWVGEAHDADLAVAPAGVRALRGERHP